MAVQESSFFDSTTGVLRLPSREAIDATRGYVAGWLHAIEVILASADDDGIFVEAFEDIAVVAANGEIGGIQIKDKAGRFSVTQEESCGMLERWAEVLNQRPNSWFQFCSTQEPGNLHNHSTAFVRWVTGEREDAVLDELRNTLYQFISDRHGGKFQRLERVAQDLDEFKSFWISIEWKLGNAGLEQLFSLVLDKIRSIFPGLEAKDLEHRLYAWIGAIAYSASSPNINDRRWSRKKLFATDPKTNDKVAFLAERIDRLIHSQDEQKTTLAEILNAVRSLHEWKDSLAGARPAADATASPPTVATRTQQQAQDRRAAQIEMRYRKTLDSEGQRLWEEIRAKIQGLEKAEAIASRPKLEEWFFGDGQLASPPIRGRAAILLADLVVLESSVKAAFEHVDTESMRQWLHRATDAFGQDVSPEDAGRLLHLEAKLLWFDGKKDEALVALEHVTDANCLSLKLSIHLEGNEDDKAIAVARTLHNDDRWADRVMLTFARNGLEQEGGAILSWAQQSSTPVCQQLCLIAWARGALQRLLKAKDDRSVLSASLSDEENQGLRDLLIRLQPILATAVAQGRPINGREREAVELAFTVARILKDHSQWQQFGALLSKAEPTSLEYARAVCRGDLVPDLDIAGRLRVDYPDSFTAGYLAAVIDVINAKNYAQMKPIVESLLPRARNTDDRDQLAPLIFEVGLHDDSVGAIEGTIEFLKTLLVPGHALIKLAEFEKHRRSGDNQQASVALDEAKDESNHVWLQFAAEWKRIHGEKEAALNLLRKAARIVGRREVTRKAFCLAYEVNDRQAMRELLEGMLASDPTDREALRNLAAMENNGGNFKEAVATIRKLEALDPDNKEVMMFLARTLSLSGSLEDAVLVFGRICSKYPNDLQPLYLKATTLDALGKRAQAFEELYAVREVFWSDIAFLMLFMDMGYKANREDEAHFAFIRIHELQKGYPNGPLRAMSLDQIKEHAKNWHAHHEGMNEKLLAGAVPWTLVGHALRRETYLDWAIRTQETSTPDRAIARAEYCVYSTNSLCVRHDPDKGNSLELIRCTSRGTPVVADLSALITLHRLGFLDKATAFFGQITIPAGFLEQFLDERRSLQPHQPSQGEATSAILRALDQGRLHSTIPVSAGVTLPWLNEHYIDDETPPAFHLIDAVRSLHSEGRLTDEELHEVQRVCHRPQRVDAATFLLAAAPTGMRTNASTLTTVYGAGLFDRLIGRVRLYLEPEEIERLRRASLSRDDLDELAKYHRELHEILSRHANVLSAEPVYPKNAGDESERDKDFHPSLAGLLLADQLQAPFFVDDRSLQCWLLNSRSGKEGEAFGSDSLLIALAEQNVITTEELTTAFLQMVRWRYRFLIPPHNVLLALVRRHTMFPPGEELRQIAQYLHECCRDPGLFCGPEPTTPPTPLGLRYFHRIVQSIAKFLFHAWHDNRFDDRALKALTHWCAAEFIPNPPQNLPYAASVMAAETTARLFLLTAVGESYQFEDVSRSNAALTEISAALGIGNDDYDSLMEIFVEQSVELPPTPGLAELDLALRRRVAVAALEHRDGLRLSTAAALADIGLVKPLPLPIDEENIDAIGDRLHHRRVEIGPGPWIGVRPNDDGTAREAIYVPSFLHHPHAGLRRAALTHLQTVWPDQPPWLTPRTVTLIEELAQTITGDNAKAARAGARLIEDALAKDFCVLLATFRQTRRIGQHPENTAAIRRIFEPSGPIFASVAEKWYLPPTQGQTIIDINVPRLSTALDQYYERYGHLPLASPHAVESVVSAWIARNGEDGVWNEIQAWADDQSRPLKKYHLARLALRYPTLISEPCRESMWHDVQNVLDGFGTETHDETVPGEAWRMVHAFAVHYLRLLEIHSFDPDAARLAALAWWMAERVTQLFVTTALQEIGPEQSGPFLRKFIQNSLIVSLKRSGLSSRLAQPLREPSIFAYATTHLASVWKCSLLEVSPADMLVLRPDLANAIDKTLLWGLAIGIFDIPELSQDAVWAIAVPWKRHAPKWLPHFPAPVEDAEIQESDGNESGSETVDESTRDDVPPNLPDLLRAILRADDEAKGFLLTRVRFEAGMGMLKPEDVGWLIEDTSWYDSVFQSLPMERFDLLTDCLLELLRVANEQWKVKLPHLLAAQMLRPDLAADRRYQAGAMTLQACVIAGRIGALVTLTNALDSADLREKMNGWWVRLNEIRQISPASVQGRLRDILAHLPAASPCANHCSEHTE